MTVGKDVGYVLFPLVSMTVGKDVRYVLSPLASMNVGKDGQVCFISPC